MLVFIVPLVAYHWLAWLLLSVFAASLCLDVLAFLQTGKAKALGYDSGFFLVDEGGRELPCELDGDCVVCWGFVSLGLKELDAKRKHGLILGQWNLASSDFHALRQLLVNA